MNSGTGRNKVVKQRLQQVPQQTVASVAPVQRTFFYFSSPPIVCAMSTSANCSRNNNGSSMCVFKSEAGGIDAEATIGSASLEILSEGIQLHSWDAWLNSGTGRNIAL